MRISKGFTLVELMIVIAVAAILVTAVIPGLSSLIARQERVSAVMDVVHALSYARTRSIINNRYVAVCKSADGKRCAEKGSWSKGWIVYTDLNSNSDFDAAEPVILSHGPLDESIILTANRDSFTFRPRSIRSTAGSLFVCAHDGTQTAAIIVSVTGRIRTSDTTADGSPVTC